MPTNFSINNILAMPQMLQGMPPGFISPPPSLPSSQQSQPLSSAPSTPLSNFFTRSSESAFSAPQPNGGIYPPPFSMLSPPTNNLPSPANPFAFFGTTFPPNFCFPNGMFSMQHFSNTKRKRRHRTIFSEEQLDILESTFQRSQYPDVVLRDQLAKDCELKEERVEVWFKNRRAKERKKNREAAPDNAKRLNSSRASSDGNSKDMSDEDYNSELDVSSDDEHHDNSQQKKKPTQKTETPRQSEDAQQSRTRASGGSGGGGKIQRGAERAANGRQTPSASSAARQGVLSSQGKKRRISIESPDNLQLQSTASGEKHSRLSSSQPTVSVTKNGHSSNSNTPSTTRSQQHSHHPPTATISNNNLKSSNGTKSMSSLSQLPQFSPLQLPHILSSKMDEIMRNNTKRTTFMLQNAGKRMATSLNCGDYGVLAAAMAKQSRENQSQNDND